MFALAVAASAQDSWRVKLNDKTILLTSKENEKANTKKIKSSELKKKGQLEVIYRDKSKDKDWVRTLLLADEEGNDIMRKEGVSNLKIKLSELKDKLGDHKKILIYTFKTPGDPELAARVRVRTVLLCTLILP